MLYASGHAVCECVSFLSSNAGGQWPVGAKKNGRGLNNSKLLTRVCVYSEMRGS